MYPVFGPDFEELWFSELDICFPVFTGCRETKYMADL